MKIAEYITGVLTQVGPLLLRAVKERWSEDKTKAAMAELINHKELELARDADSKVRSYLDSVRERERR